MIGHEPLIRKLVDLTADSQQQDRDSLEVLKARCFNDTSLIRRTLINAVCDPRFKFKAGYAKDWKKKAKTALMALDSQLINHTNLTEEIALEMLDLFWRKWVNQLLIFHPVVRPKGSLSMLDTPSHRKKEDKKEDMSIISSFLNGLPFLFGGESPFIDVNGEDDDDENGEDGELNEDDSEKPVPQKPMPGKGFQRNLEVTVLNKIPPSLLELARKIGRSGGNKFSKQTSRFEVAAKSDITGIAVGDNLAAVLPSELALLAVPATEKVFLHKMASKRLQLFASASHSSAQEKRKDGPVIICLDSSGSMTGYPVRIATALTVATALIAWRRHRNVMIVKYSDSYDCYDAGDSAANLAKVLNFLSRTEGGGNNENEMFNWLFNEVKPNLQEYDTSDILCITDFGWTHLDADTLETIANQKAQGMRFFGLNIVDMPRRETSMISTSSQIESMEVCDSLWYYENGVCREVRALPPHKTKSKQSYK